MFLSLLNSRNKSRSAIGKLREKERLSFGQKLTRLGDRMRDPQWRKYGMTLMAGKMIALGLIAQSEFRKQGQPDLLARVTWIGGIVSLLLGIAFTILRLSMTGRTY